MLIKVLLDSLKLFFAFQRPREGLVWQTIFEV
jgi:hypothetical protein